MRSASLGLTSIVLLVSLGTLLLSSPAGADTTNWVSAQNGYWSDATHWDNGVPSNGVTTYDAVIAATGASTYTVTLDSVPTIDSFTLNSPQATLSISGVLQLVGSTPSQVLAGTLRFSNGTLRGGEIDIHGGIIAGTGNLDDVMVQGDVNIGNGANLTLINGSRINGNITLGSGTLSYAAWVNFQGDKTVSEGNIIFGNTRKAGYGPGSTWMGPRVAASGSLTIASNVTVTGGQGRLEADNGTITNQGTIIANKSQTCLDFYNMSGGQLTNSGSIQVSNGAMLTYTTGSSAFVNEGTVDLTGASTWYTLYCPRYVQNKGITRLGPGSDLVASDSCNILGGRLEGPGSIYQCLSIYANADVSPGDGLGIMRWYADQATLGPNSRLLLDLGDPSNNDCLEILKNGDFVSSALLLQGEVDVTAWAGFGNGRYVIMTYDGTLTNDGMHVGTMPDGFSATLDYSVPGEVGLLVVPEPATLSLLALGGIALLKRPERNGLAGGRTAT